MGVTVIVPTFNGERHVGELVAAILSQRGVAWELIVADDGSTDRTVELVRQQLEANPEANARIEEFGTNSGKAVVVNAAARKAGFSKFVLLDQDDVPAPGYLAAMSRALDDHAFVSATVSLERLNPADVVSGLFRADTDYFRIPFSRDGRVEMAPVSMGGTLAVRRSVFLEHGGLDHRAAASDDLDFCLRLWLAGISLATEPRAVLHYRLRTRPVEVFRQRIRYGRGWARLYRSFWSAGIVAPTMMDSVAAVIRAHLRLLSLKRSSCYAYAADIGFLAGRSLGNLSSR